MPKCPTCDAMMKMPAKKTATKTATPAQMKAREAFTKMVREKKK